MKQIISLVGVKTLSKHEQKSISGGMHKCCDPEASCCYPSSGSCKYVYSDRIQGCA